MEDPSVNEERNWQRKTEKARMEIWLRFPSDYEECSYFIFSRIWRRTEVKSVQKN